MGEAEHFRMKRLARERGDDGVERRREPAWPVQRIAQDWGTAALEQMYAYLVGAPRLDGAADEGRERSEPFDHHDVGLRPLTSATSLVPIGE